MNKILLITAFTPSEVAAAEKNTKILLNKLSSLYDIDLVYFKYLNDKPYIPVSKNINIIKVLGNSISDKLFSIAQLPYLHPVFSVRYRKTLQRFLQEKIDTENYSAIIFDHSQTMIYAQKLKFNGPKILISHDVEVQRFERVSNKLMTWLCKKSENYVLNAPNAHITTFCQKDVDLIKKYYNKDAHLSYIYIDEKILENLPGTIEESFVMFGNWKRPDNSEGAIWLLNQLGSFLKTKITINIIGKGFPIDKLNVNKDRIEIRNLGFMDNPYELIANSKAMLCPLLTGAGIKVKVIESLACGTPVIGTKVAFEGFPEKFKSLMTECSTPKEFAVAIEKVNYDSESRNLFRNMFVEEYTAESIPEWINKLLQ